MEKKVFVISGATASGKSSLAMSLAERKNVAIINADSLQIYKDLPILSAQPSESERSKVKHLLYSYLDFDQSSTVMDWLRRVNLAINESFEMELIPVIVGGSGMYISKLINGINDIPQISSGVRDSVQLLYDEQGSEALIMEMLKLGIDEGEIKHVDQHRLIRQYQVLKQTGKPISYWHKMPKEFIINPEIFLHINIEIDRKNLYERCNNRFEVMFEAGVDKEVESLASKISIDSGYQVTNTLGYYEIRDYLSGKIDKDEMVSLTCQKTRNYAKRQLTWFRNQFSDKNVFDSTDKALEFILEGLR